MQRRAFVAGNWKMNGSLAANQQLVAALLEPLAAVAADVVLCVPHPYLDQVSRLLADSALVLGAQDASDQPAGAYTGDVAAGMLVDFGCRYVLVGHSERRALHGESDALVAAKFAAAHQAGLVPVLCVGETLVEREANATLAVVRRQLDAVLQQCGAAALGSAVLAYEPVWAIGTGLTATPAQAQAVHAALRQHVAGHDAAIAAQLRIVYGGSVKPGNAAALFAQPDIDGALVGGASLDANEFLAICQAIQQ